MSPFCTSPALPKTRRPVLFSLLVLTVFLQAGCEKPYPAAADRLANLIGDDREYTLVPPEIFDELGWELPDRGETVRSLADSAPGFAFDPRQLEGLDRETLGYQARWHEVRYRYYGLEWDIAGLHLEPTRPVGQLPTVAFINGGSANFYEFLVDPLNNPGLGQYLAQKVPVLLISIPGNYKHGGWSDRFADRRPAYLLDGRMSDSELAARNAIFTFTLICEGVARLVEEATEGPLLIVGHSTGGEIQFLLRDRLGGRLRQRSLGWGTGGPAVLRRQWEDEMAQRGDRAPVAEDYVPIDRVRGRSPEGYARGTYIGPLNPLPGDSRLEQARAWFQREFHRRPQFKQVIQDLEHRGEFEHRDSMEQTIRETIQASQLPFPVEEVIHDLFSTMRTPLDGYRRMMFTTASLDGGHWNREEPEKARELWLARRFKELNPGADIRVVAYDVPMTHYGHIERPKQLAGALLAAIAWLEEGGRR